MLIVLAFIGGTGIKTILKAKSCPGIGIRRGTRFGGPGFAPRRQKPHRERAPYWPHVDWPVFHSQLSAKFFSLVLSNLDNLKSECRVTGLLG